MSDTYDHTTGEVLTISDYQTSTAVNEIFSALAKAQGEIKNATKDAANPHFRSKYADLASISDACRVPLSKHGVAVIQIPHNDGGDVGVTTVLGHSSGQWISGRIKVAPAKWDAQGLGSVVTYLRRYCLAAMAGVAPGDDDDGEGAMGRGAPNGNGATLQAPASNTRTSAARKPPPQPSEREQDMNRLASEIKREIDESTTLKSLNDAMQSRGQDFTKAEPKEKSDLATVKAFSESAYTFLTDRANKARGNLAQVPAQAAE